MPNSKLSSIFCLSIVILLVILISIPTLITKPHLWADEAKSIELARNFLNYGKLDIQIAPEEFTGFPQILQSTGYPVTVPLALVFKLFGYGLAQARIYMLFWMAVFLAVSFIFLRKLFGDWEAISALFLIVSFASFYDSGRTVVGEIPGMAFLILGLYFWLSRNAHYLSGFWLGLSVVAKPSVFGLIIPAVVLLVLSEKEGGFFKKIFKIGVGIIPAAIIWILLVLEKPFLRATWLDIISFYKSPYGESPIWQNIINNFLNIPHSTTFIYFGLLFLVIIFGKQFIDDKKMKSFYNFVIIYGIFAFIYYLRSPGWLRYILIAELLVLFSLPSALSLLAARIKVFIPKLKLSSEKLSICSITILVIVQLTHFFTAAQIFYSDSAIKVSELLNKEFPDKSIGTINSLDLSVLLKTDKRFQVIEMTGIPIMGKNPLFYEPLPEIIVFTSNEILPKESQSVLTANYALYSKANDYFIYSRR